mgnify:CR=1 FL=1
MRADASFAVPVKLWALLCVFAGVTIGGNVLLTCILTGGALLYLVLQRNFRLAASYGCFYLLLALLLYGIRFHGLHMPVFSEFYVLMFWNLSPIFLVSWDLITTPPGMLSAFLSRLRMPTPFILGLLVVFRFFPTMRTELKGVGRSMKNRGLTAAGQLLAHPVQSMEYVLVPFLLRVLQLADQLSVSAVARGAERPGVRGSYYEKRAGARDHIAAAACALVTASYRRERLSGTHRAGAAPHGSEKEDGKSPPAAENARAEGSAAHRPPSGWRRSSPTCSTSSYAAPTVFSQRYPKWSALPAGKRGRS